MGSPHFHLSLLSCHSPTLGQAPANQVFLLKHLGLRKHDCSLILVLLNLFCIWHDRPSFLLVESYRQTPAICMFCLACYPVDIRKTVPYLHSMWRNWDRKKSCDLPIRDNYESKSSLHTSDFSVKPHSLPSISACSHLLQHQLSPCYTGHRILESFLILSSSHSPMSSYLSQSLLNVPWSYLPFYASPSIQFSGYLLKILNLIIQGKASFSKTQDFGTLPPKFTYTTIRLISLNTTLDYSPYTSLRKSQNPFKGL